jgi:hypothetical protein
VTATLAQALAEPECLHHGHQWGVPIMARRKCWRCGILTTEIAALPTVQQLDAWANAPTTPEPAPGPRPLPVFTRQPEPAQAGRRAGCLLAVSLLAALVGIHVGGRE